MSSPTPPPPRDPSWLRADLTRLQTLRAQSQDELVSTLRVIDAVTEKIDERLVELARALHPSRFDRE